MLPFKQQFQPAAHPYNDMCSLKTRVQYFTHTQTPMHTNTHTHTHTHTQTHTHTMHKNYKFAEAFRKLRAFVIRHHIKEN